MTRIIGKMTEKSTCELTLKASYYNYLLLSARLFPHYNAVTVFRFPPFRGKGLCKLTLVCVPELLVRGGCLSGTSG